MHAVQEKRRVTYEEVEGWTNARLGEKVRVCDIVKKTGGRLVK